MGEYRLSVRARGDLIDIYAYTDQKFGRYQAEAYHAGLERTFGLVADFPGMGKDASELLPNLRRFRFQSHHIFYSAEPGFVLIRALIHKSMDLRPDLFE